MSGGGRRKDPKKHTSEVDHEIGRRMKARRMELGMNQQSLAQQIGVSYQQVQKYENGTDRVGAARLWLAGNALGCPIGYFFGDLAAAGLQEAGAAYESSTEAQRVLSTEDGRSLVQSFIAIDDAAVRRKLVELAAAMAAATRRPPGGGRRVRRMRKV